MKFKIAVMLIVVLGMVGVVNANIADFDDLSLSPNSYWNGSDGTGGFASGGAYFKNNYNSTYYSWDGFAYSNKSQQNPVEKGMAGQYTAIYGKGQGNSVNYAVGYDAKSSGFGIERPTLTLDTTGVVSGVYVTNNNYAYYSMLEGDSFAKKFGGTTGSDEDWFLLTITGIDVSGLATGTIDFYLADYRFEDDYILNTWEFVDLSSLGAVKSLEFALSSSDNGDYGMNTPAYFSMDTVVPEPTTVILLGLGGLLLGRRRK